MSMNWNFSRAAKYSPSRRKPENERGPREKRLFRRKTDRLQRVRRQDHRLGIRLIVGQGDRDRMGQQQLEQRRAAFARQEKAQPVEAKLGERHGGIGATQADAQAGYGSRGGRIGRRRQRHARQPDGVDLHRPQRQRIGGAKQARLAADRFGFDREAGRQTGGTGHSGVGREPGDRHRWHGSEIVRVEHREQAVGELRELVIEPVLHARAEKGDTLEQAADMRVVDVL